MAIATLNDYINSVKQTFALKKTASRTSVAFQPFTVRDLAGFPGAGTLAIGNTTNGIVPTDALAGAPLINTFINGSAIGYLSNVEYWNSVACKLALYDCVFAAGAYAFNANQALTAQPSYLGRIPGGTALDTNGVTEIWVENVTAATGNLAVTVTYTNAEGVAGRSTGAVGMGGAPTVGRMWQLPFQAGDRGVSQITNIAGTVATVGTFNVLILRPLWRARVKAAGDGDIHDFYRTGGRRLYDTSSLFLVVTADSTATGLPDLDITVANA
ncbi:MAG: hypothetical protein ACRDBG_00190 [Waterburya sp.]